MERIWREELSMKNESKFRSSSRCVKLTLEEYLQLFDSRSFSDFSINHLNQIIAMHGYKRIHKTPKKVLTEAMSAIALASPCRSTLNDQISPSESAYTLESVINDLNELNWQECTITSVETIGYNTRSLTVGSGAGNSSAVEPKKRRRKTYKEKDEPKRIALKPKGNEIVSVSSEDKRSKRVPKMKNICDCKGCVSTVHLS